MLTLGRARHLLERALAEFAPEWELTGDCTELNVREPDDWLSGSVSYGVTLRQRATGALKVVGKRRGPQAGAGYCRGVSFRVLEAYNERNTDPIVRFLQEVGIASAARQRAHGPRMPGSASASARGSRAAAAAPARGSVSPASRAAAAPPARPPAPTPEETLSSLAAAVDEAAAEAEVSAPDRRAKSAGRGGLKKFLKLRPSMLKRLVKGARRRTKDVEVSGRVFTGSSPVLDLTRVTPTLAVNGKAVRLVLSFAGGEGVIVFECSRVVNAEFAGQTGEKALASILTAYGVQQLA